VLHETVLTDLDDAFEPIGFGANRNELLYYDTVDGRTALLAMDLENGRRTRVVYSHPTLDVGGGRTLGKENRLVSVTYVDDRPHMHFIDQRIDKMNAALAPSFPGSAISVFDEDWSQRYYLVFVSGATNPGSYYRFDSQTRVLARIARTYPALADRELAPMREIRYPAPDGVQIPAYLTLPRGAKEKAAAVILPHGGPSSRDYWEYDFLPQYLAANGYAVLQTNYRGSDGYGVAWRGAGGFRDWRRAVDDIAAGVDYLVSQGIADGKRICTIGWSYGGYAALMSAIEKPKLFRCVASIAGVTDPRALSDHQGNFVEGHSVRQLIGSSTDEVRIAGSPIERVGELAVPVLVAHAEQDLDVPFSQAVAFTKALRRARKNVEFAQYRSAEHDIRPERYRVDLLTRLGGFLEKNLD
jgi:dipeptidyl aminopeptidase/acylaminoacyl peptidase